MKIFREKEEAILPEFATSGSACFDLRSCFDESDRIVAYNPHNKEMKLPVKVQGDKKYIQLHASFRTLVPTGLIFDIPKNHVLKVFIRSGIALKHGLLLANSTAIIDSDYVDPTYVMLYNATDTPYTLYSGERIAQAMLQKLETYTLVERKTPPSQKTERTGGLGSTGTE